MIKFVYSIVILVPSLLALSIASVAECPHQTEGLLRWSEESTWNGNIPKENDDIIIDKPILLDTQPPLFHSITIKPNGMLVWDPEADPIQLKVHWIDVEGEFHIGGDNCRFTNEARLTFVGNVADLDEFGKDKGLYVRENGVLEIHGEDKFPWTKLAETAPKRDFIYYRKIVIGLDPATDSGIMVYTIDPTTGQLIEERYFNTNQRRVYVYDEIEKLGEFVNSAADNTIIGMAVLDKSVTNKRITLAPLADIVCDLGYGNKTCPTRIGDQVYNQNDVQLSWVFLTQKGNYESTREEYLQKADSNQYTEVSNEFTDKAVTISSYVTIGGDTDYVNIYVTSNLEVGPILSLMDDVSSWKIGDEIVIASTDYNWRQAEVRKIVECSECSKSQIRINEPLDYMHYGKIYKTVDMRGEVALLTRKIKIVSEDAEESDEYGGHIKILKGFKSARVQGAELVNLGASQVLGRYSLHLHMCHDVYGRQLFRQNSIHHANTRCVTIHGTHNATVSENVCFMTKGHGYFLEDGGERDTYFYGNIGLGQEVGYLIPTDSTPSTFWITNPNTRMINNVAAGSEGHGFWFLWPTEFPLGPSADQGFMLGMEARYSQLKGFKHNVAHSSSASGLFIDSRLEEDGTTKMYIKWRPKENPVHYLLYKNSTNKPALVEYFTGYKNTNNNVWIRVGELTLTHISSSDSLRGVALVRQDGKMVPTFEKSVVIGLSDNLGEPILLPNGILYERSVPRFSEPARPQIGWLIVKRPTPVDSVWFDDYRNTSLYAMSALGYRLQFHMPTIMIHRMSNLKFGFDDPDEGNRVFNFRKGHPYYSEREAEITKHFQDVDGSVVGFPNKTHMVVYPIPFHLTPSCALRPSWFMAYCPEPVGSLKISLSDAFSESTFDEDADNAETEEVISTSDNSVILTRDEDHENLYLEHSFSDNFPFNVFLDRSHSYTVRFTAAFPPDELVLYGIAMTKSDYVRVGICIPRGATYEMEKRVSRDVVHKSFTEVFSLNELDEDETGDKYYHDKDVGYFAILLRHLHDYGPEGKGQCPGDKCVSLTMFPNLTNADPSDVNCLPRLYDKYAVEDLIPQNGQTFDPAENDIDDRMLPHTSREPPQTWGAGPSLTPRPEYSSGIY